MNTPGKHARMLGDYRVLDVKDNSKEALIDAIKHLPLKPKYAAFERTLRGYWPIVIGGHMPSKDDAIGINSVVERAAAPLFLLGHTSEALTANVFFYLLILASTSSSTLAFPSLGFMLGGAGLLTAIGGIGMTAGYKLSRDSKYSWLRHAKYFTPSFTVAFLSGLVLYCLPVLPANVFNGNYEDETISPLMQEPYASLITVWVLILLSSLVFFGYSSMRSYMHNDQLLTDIAEKRKELLPDESRLGSHPSRKDTGTSSTAGTAMLTGSPLHKASRNVDPAINEIEIKVVEKEGAINTPRQTN